MISKKAYNILSIPGVREIGGYVHIVSQVTGDSEDAIHQYLDVEMKVADSSENERYSKLQHDINAFANEFSDEFRHERRLTFLKEKLSALESKYAKAWKTGDLERLWKEIKSVKTSIEFALGISDHLSVEMIQRAREYPITELIPNKNMWAICPFHEDRHPSLYLKNNFYHCFACGVSGSTIDLYMKLNNASFPETVKRLQTC
jgi:hypothetical protein